MDNGELNISVYRTNDSVDNFRLRCTIRETSKPFTSDGRRQDNKAFEEDLTLSWQEKKYGPKDIANFLTNKSKGLKNFAKDGAEAETFRHMTHLEERGKPLMNLLSPVMLYTYTDKNEGKPLERAPVRFSADDNIEPYLGVATSSHSGRAEAANREKHAGDRIFRERPYKIMHVCMATDVDVDAIQNSPLFPEAHYNEHVLASIRIYNDGMVECAPRLSEAMNEEGGKGSETVGPSMFSNDLTAAAAINPNKGLKLSTYTVNSAAGREFEYCLQNLHRTDSPAELDCKRRTELAKDAAAARNNRINEEDDENCWRQDPPSKGFHKSIAFFAEIVSGTSFTGDRLYVDYEVLTPNGWNLRTGNLVDGLGEQDLINKAMGDDGVIDDQKEAEHATAARNLLDVDGFADGDEAEGMLRGVTQMALAYDCAGGQVLHGKRQRWKGNRRNFLLDSMSRHIGGYGYFFFNVLCILLGVNYPLWIVSAMLLLMALVTGTPSGPTQAVLCRDKDSTEKGRGSMKTKANRVMEGPLVSQPVANFNHLINLSFDFKDGNDADVPSAPSSSVPTVVFTVYSIGFLGQIQVEGYGYHHLPEVGSTEDVEIQMWKPLGGINSQMRDYFLGASPHLLDSAKFFNASGNAKNNGVLNRFGMRSENSGKIRFRLQAAVTDPRKARHSIVKKERKEDTKLNGARRTVNEILKNYRGGSDLSSSMQMAAGAMGMTMTKTSVSSSGMTDLSKRAEMLIAQAKERVRLSGGLSSVGGGSVLASTQEESTRSSVDYSAPLNLRDSAGRPQMASLDMDKVPGASRGVRRYADEGEEGESLLGTL